MLSNNLTVSHLKLTQNSGDVGYILVVLQRKYNELRGNPYSPKLPVFMVKRRLACIQSATEQDMRNMLLGAPPASHLANNSKIWPKYGANVDFSGAEI